MDSGASLSSLDPVERLAEEYLRRRRQGEHPTAAEYAARYPELAVRILDLFPALEWIEGLVPTPEDHAGLSHNPVEACAPAGPRGRAQRLGDYALLRELGRGGMGVVYEAEHESLKNRVALKVMHARFRDDRTYVRRFRVEARAAAKLHHTNIVPVFDYGEQDGICYYAMQYIDGVGLDSVLDDVRRLRDRADGRSQVTEGRGAYAATEPVDGPALAVSRSLLTGRFTTARSASGGLAGAPTSTLDLEQPEQTAFVPVPAGPPSTSPAALCAGSASSSSLAGQPEAAYFREIARLGAQTADALDHAHRHNVVHRDIKPSNLLLDAYGNAWVTDFGLAKLVEGNDLSQSHDLVGTMRFMAPERFRGVSDPMGDVYSLGATLYELLTLKPAFAEQDQARLIDQIAHELPAPLRQHDRRIPRDLETLVQKALAKDPKDRFASASEMRDELRRYLEGRPIRSRPVGAVERLWRWGQRNPGLAALHALAATLTSLIAVISTVAAWIYYGQRNELQFQQTQIKASLTRAEHAERDAKRSEHEARLALGQSLISEGAALQRGGLAGQRFESLKRLARAAEPLGADPDGRKRFPEIRNHTIAALCLPDFRAQTPHDYGVGLAVDVDPALERYAVVESTGVVIVRRLDDNQEIFRLPGSDRTGFWYASPVFSPDGELLLAQYYYAGNTGRLSRIWDVSRRELLGSLPASTGAMFDPDSRRLFFGAPEGGIAVWDRVARRVVRRLPLDFAPNVLAVDPEGRRLAVDSLDQKAPRISILEPETGRVLGDLKPNHTVGVLAWSADGKLLAVAGGFADPRIYVWDVGRRTLVSALAGHTGTVISAQFAHSGHVLATAAWDGTTRLWDGVSGEPLAMAPGNLRGQFTQDDRRLAVVNRGKIGAWEIATGAECRTLHPGMVGNRTEAIRSDLSGLDSAAFSPDGRLLATSAAWVDGVYLWEAETGRELAHLQAGFCDVVLFHPDGQSLLSAGRWGWYLWRIRPDRDCGPGAIRIGPPELLREYAGKSAAPAAWMPDRRTLALADNANARTLLVDTGHPHPAWSHAPALANGTNRRMYPIAVSPDGRWLAAGGFKERGVNVWDLRQRRLERVLRPDDAASDTSFLVRFSPDGRWLVSMSSSDAKNAYHFWRAGTWELDHRIDQEGRASLCEPPAFTSDGGLMALGIAPDQVALYSAATGEELARLTTLHSLTPAPLAFSPDGAKLVASTNQNTMLVWDLRLIRNQLAPLRLDWDAPQYPPPDFSPSTAAASRLTRTVRIVGKVVETEARRAAELAEMNHRLAANPDDAAARLHRGWLYTVQKKWSDAIADLKRLPRGGPEEIDICWLLGDAYEESRRFPAAFQVFDHLVQLLPQDREARFRRGLLASALNQTGLACEDFSHILAADPDLDRARYHRARALLRLGRHQDALADLTILIRRVPETSQLFELRGAIHEALGEHEQARADREKASSLLPREPVALNYRSWLLATGPIAERDAELAVALARRAVALAPKEQLYLNTLGVALYRAGQYPEAISALERSLAVGKGQFDGFDLFFLAMAYNQLGHRGQARDSYNRAVRWLEKQQSLPESHTRELAAFRAEASEVLGIPAEELPTEVFARE